jgi:hypothetical protein
MAPVGYVVMQHAVRLDRPVKAYDRSMQRIPSVYRETVLDEKPLPVTPRVSEDPTLSPPSSTTEASWPSPRKPGSPCFT